MGRKGQQERKGKAIPDAQFDFSISHLSIGQLNPFYCLETPSFVTKFSTLLQGRNNFRVRIHYQLLPSSYVTQFTSSNRPVHPFLSSGDPTFGYLDSHLRWAWFELSLILLDTPTPLLPHLTKLTLLQL